MTTHTAGGPQTGDGARQGFDAKLPATPLGKWSRQKERSLITLLTIVPTIFVTMFLIGEFLFPH